MWVIREGLKPGQRVVVEGGTEGSCGQDSEPKPYLDVNGKRGAGDKTGGK